MNLSKSETNAPGRDKDTRLDFLKEEIRVAKLLDHPKLGEEGNEE